MGKSGKTWRNAARVALPIATAALSIANGGIATTRTRIRPRMSPTPLIVGFLGGALAAFFVLRAHSSV